MILHAIGNSEDGLVINGIVHCASCVYSQNLVLGRQAEVETILVYI